ncbi:MAG TPA: flavodoxin family protein [Syntrophomonadaceae bacterium]|nr:flavodoxin family protein [Syntrophomonadaceae bacterium]HOQ09254.1 flavodoxin family protein [Syntrophomonadaceae bacterium]HPU49353.1 flavodoxin family protein [Syntrophomonadaceae bacterium]
MKVLFINGSGSDSSINGFIRYAIDTLSAHGHDAKELVLRDMKYSPCRGCFNCWVKTPGTCVYKDDGDIICKEFITSDMVILSSPVIMGYPSALAKNALDRIIPLLHPYLEDVGGEVHHMKRYNKYPELGLLLEKLEDTDSEDIEIIHDIFKRAALNIQGSLKFMKFTDSPVEEVVHAIINN